MSDAKEILAELDVESFLDFQGIDYKTAHGSSGYLLALRECPFCSDDKWKSLIILESRIFTCNKCQTHKYIGNFICETIGLPWGKMLRLVESFVRDQGWRPKKAHTAPVIEDKVKLPLSHTLPTKDGQNLPYLLERGISNHECQYFHLRYCFDGWWSFTTPEGKKSGQNFQNRVIIPVYDLNGELVTFQGRDITGTADNKYLFPKGLPGTGRYLYNGQNAIHAKRVVMNEGAFDVIATKTALDENPTLRDVVAVGSFGKHLSYGDINGNDQIARFLNLQRKGLEQVTIMWDGEVKALTSAIEAGLRLMRLGLEIRIALLPNNKDPNELPSLIVQNAFISATRLTKAIAIKWGISNPYKR